jgi:GAF domain-containing protein
VHSMLAVRVFVRQDELGVLTLYSLHPFGFDEDAERIALLFAAHAAVAVAGAQQEQNLTTALTSRDGIVRPRES